MKKIIILPIASVLLVFSSIVFAIIAFAKSDILFSIICFSVCWLSLFLAILYAIIGRKEAKKMAIVLTIIVSLLVSSITVPMGLFNVFAISFRQNSDIQIQESYGSPSLIVNDAVNGGIISFQEPIEPNEVVHDDSLKVKAALSKMSWTETNDDTTPSVDEEYFFYTVTLNKHGYEGRIYVYSSGFVAISVNGSFGKSSASFSKSGKTTKQEALDTIAIARETYNAYFDSYKEDREKAKVEGDLDHFLVAMEKQDIVWTKYEGSVRPDDGTVLAAIKNTNHVFSDNPRDPFFDSLYYNFDEKAGYAGNWSYMLHQNLDKVLLSYRYSDSSSRSHTYRFYYDIAVEEGQAIVSAVNKLT